MSGPIFGAQIISTGLEWYDTNGFRIEVESIWVEQRQKERQKERQKGFEKGRPVDSKSELSGMLDILLL